MAHGDSTAAPTPVEWRVVGLRRWLPVVLGVCFLGNAADDVAHLVVDDVSPSDPRGLQVFFLVVGVVGVLAAVALLVATWRTRVTLTPTGIAVRTVRRRFFPYDAIGRVYRDRFTSGAITLLLDDDRKVRLPAPVAGLGTSSPEIDAALEQIRARIPAA